jgi:hypothetical protein
MTASRAEEGRVQRQQSVAGGCVSTEQRMQPVQQISARCASRITQNPGERQLTEGLMGCGERPGALLRGHLGPYQSVIAPTKPG